MVYCTNKPLSLYHDNIANKRKSAGTLQIMICILVQKEQNFFKKIIKLCNGPHSLLYHLKIVDTVVDNNVAKVIIYFVDI